MQIAIIGGGVGGLAVAYNLITMWPSSKGPLPSLTVYEKSGRFGGNGDTVSVSLGYDMHIFPDPPSYNRWADLGVNDFNKTAYVNIVEVMNAIGYYRIRAARGLDVLLHARRVDSLRVRQFTVHEPDDHDAGAVVERGGRLHEAGCHRRAEPGLRPVHGAPLYRDGLLAESGL